VHVLHGWLINPYVEDVIGNAIFLAILGLLGYGVFFVTGRRQIRRFFGLDRDKRMAIFTSRLDVPPLTTSGVDGRKRSFGGVAVPEYESRLVALVEQFLFSVMPSSINRIGPLRAIRWNDLVIVVNAAPATKEQVERKGSLLAFGSSAYNSVSLAIEEEMSPFAKVAPDGNLIEISHKGEVTRIELDPVNVRTCFLQRLTRPETGQMVFYAAGFSAGGTECAVRYLLGNWKKLSKRYPGRMPFCVLMSYREEEPTMYDELDSFS
jgi:hypothetical protein